MPQPQLAACPRTCRQPQVRVETWLSAAAARDALLDEARIGLFASVPRELSPRWLYDARGSALFDDITLLPEYYLTRREREILAKHAGDIARVTQAKTLCELGGGSADKTCALLDALLVEGTLEAYSALDVSESALEGALDTLSRRYPSLRINGAIGDFEHHLLALEAAAPRVIAFLGGTIGNLKTHSRARFLAQVARILGPGDFFLLGADLVKPRERLLPAYDDAAKVTAAFNLNVLRVLNRELGADFTLEAFRHEARFDEQESWMEMWLIASRAQEISIPALGQTLRLDAGEGIRTEVSTKFTPAQLRREHQDAGLEEAALWTDHRGDYSLSLWRRALRQP